MSKADLADPDVTAGWLAHFGATPQGASSDGGAPVVFAIALRSDRPAETRTRLMEVCRRLPPPGRQRPALRAMVVGIPNVGKSTLINTLMTRKVAKVGDEPAVTQGQQHVTLKNGMVLSDNPGILWPEFEDQDTALRLALAGALPDRAIDYESVALFGGALFLQRYPALLIARFGIEPLPLRAEDLLVEIGRRRGGLRSQAAVDLHKAADALIHDFRSGALGRISLEEAPPSPATAK